MKLLVISDVHKEELWLKLFNWIERRYRSMDVDVILFNGDIFGEFESTMPRIKRYLTKKSSALLKLCAPKSSRTLIEFSEKIACGVWLNDDEIKKLGRAVVDYVKERYNLAIKKLKRLCTFGLPVLYNLGNHEAPTMAFNILLEELSDLTKLDYPLLVKALACLSEKDKNVIGQIFQTFMKNIRHLEKEQSFKYIGDKVIQESRTTHIGLSGMTLNYAPQDFFEKAKKNLKSGGDVILYRHKNSPNIRLVYECIKQPQNPIWKFINYCESISSTTFLINSHHHWGASEELERRYGAVFAQYRSFYFFANPVAIRGKISILDTDKKQVTEIDFLENTKRKVPLVKLESQTEILS